MFNIIVISSSHRRHKLVRSSSPYSVITSLQCISSITFMYHVSLLNHSSCETSTLQEQSVMIFSGKHNHAASSSTPVCCCGTIVRGVAPPFGIIPMVALRLLMLLLPQAG